MTTQIQKLIEQFHQHLLEFADLRRDVQEALSWITTHDQNAKDVARTHADSKTWFWRTVFASIIVFVVGGTLNGIVMLAGIFISLMLNDKFSAFVQTFVYLVRSH